MSGGERGDADPTAPPESAALPDPAVLPDPATLLQVAVDVSREAGDLLLERYESGRQDGVRSKSTPTDLVSEADLASEQAIVSHLRRLRPEDGLLGEEGAGSDGVSGLRWVIDPLDGTVNFLFSIPQWCVSIAVQDREGVTLAGAVFDPCRGELWAARCDGPATLNGVEIHGSQRQDMPTAMVATGFAYDAAVRSEQAKTIARLIPLVRDIRRLGSAALDLAWSAAGRYDAYFERSVKVWDVAAGALICERAGLAVRELPAKGALPWGLLAAAPALVEPLLAVVA